MAPANLAAAAGGSCEPAAKPGAAESGLGFERQTGGAFLIRSAPAAAFEVSGGGAGAGFGKAAAKLKQRIQSYRKAGGPGNRRRTLRNPNNSEKRAPN